MAGAIKKALTAVKSEKISEEVRQEILSAASSLLKAIRLENVKERVKAADNQAIDANIRNTQIQQAV